MTSNKSFSLGDRIIISNKHYWAKNATGTVSIPPKLISRKNQDKLKSKTWYRCIQTQKGELHFYWIEFDTPQIDADGDGPYKSGEIESSVLTLLVNS